MEVIKIIDHIWWEEKEEFLLAEDQDSFWVLYLLVEGECYYKIGEVSGIAKSPCVLICPPHTVFERKVLNRSSKNIRRMKVTLFCQQEEVDTIKDFMTENFKSVETLKVQKLFENPDKIKISMTVEIVSRKPVQSLYKKIEKLKGIDSISIQGVNE